MSILYYVQDSRYYLGNTVVWLCIDGKHTDDVNKAKVFTADEARVLTGGKDFYVSWPKIYIDKKTRPTVDMRHIERREGERAVKSIVTYLPQCSHCDDIISEATCYLHGCDKWEESQREGKSEPKETKEKPDG